MTCDGKFRRIASVELVVSEQVFPEGRRRRRLLMSYDDTKYYNSSATNSSILNNTAINTTINATIEPEMGASTVFSINGMCRNCMVSETGSFQLFDDAFRRRLKQTLDDSRWLEEEDDDADWYLGSGERCECPVGVEPTDELVGAMSANDFQQVYSNKIETLVKEGELVSVTKNVEKVIEGTQVNCSNQVENFRAAVYTGLKVGSWCCFYIIRRRELARHV